MPIYAQRISPYFYASSMYEKDNSNNNKHTQIEVQIQLKQSQITHILIQSENLF
jgi:hypothetical protein